MERNRIREAAAGGGDGANKVKIEFLTRFLPSFNSFDIPMCSHPLKKRKGKSEPVKFSQIQLTETGERGLLTPKKGGFPGFSEGRAYHV